MRYIRLFTRYIKGFQAVLVGFSGGKVRVFTESVCKANEKTMKLSPMEIVNRMINTEEELKHFIKQNNVRAPADCHLYG